MVAVNVKLQLPDALAREAEASHLLTAEAIEALLRDEIRRRKVARLFEAADRLASLNGVSLTAEEVEAEVQAARTERRVPGAGGR